MTQRENEKVQLKGIIEEFDLGLVKTVLNELSADLMPKVSDFNNQGERCKHGENGCIGKEEFELSLEAQYDQYNFLSAHFLTEGSVVQKAIAMVTLKSTYGDLNAGDGWGSGFLISNSLFMTNNHVIWDKAFCDKVNMQFMYQDNYNSQPAINSEFFETNENSFFHTNASLDYTIVRLKRKPYRFRINSGLVNIREDSEYYNSTNKHEYADSEQLEELNYIKDLIARKIPMSSFDPARIFQIFGYTPGNKYGYIPLNLAVSYPEGLRLNVIQHPQGRKKEVVVQQNELTDVHTNVIHYFSDTDFGSSGSPVFNNTWDLVALHHARQPSESANEGIRIDRIVEDLRNEFQTSNPEILTELGI